MPGGLGYGGGPWGGGAWGGAGLLATESECDLFGFESCDTMPGILSSPIVVGVGDASQLIAGYPPPGVTCDLGLLSGDSVDPGFPQTTAYVTAFPAGGIPSEYTLEITLGFEELPNDFTSITTNHCMFSVGQPTGPCVAFFISKAGIAYAGAAHYNPASPSVGSLVLDTALQQIPGSSAYISLNAYYTFRVAVSATAGAVYLYATLATQVALSGHQLIAVLPTIDASVIATPPSLNQAGVSVAGTSIQPTRVGLDRWCLASQLIIPNIQPVANAGEDQAARLCSVIQLDGSASFDPEGSPLNYAWRLIDGPEDSELVEIGFDGVTHPLGPPTGFTDKFYSIKLAAVESADAIAVGDVLLVNALAYTIVAKGTDGDGFYVRTALEEIPDNLSSSPFKLLRQRGLGDFRFDEKPTFYPDAVGFYRFDLVVFDGLLHSEPSIVIVNVLESPLPRGCLPNTSFLYNYFSDFWNLVEDSDRVATIWDGIAQVTATELYTLWQHEYSKSLRDVQRTFVRRWLHYDTLLAEPIPELTKIRTIWSGVQSTTIPVVGGDNTINGSVLGLTSPLFGNVQVGFVNSLLPNEFARELRNRLLEIDDRFIVTVITERDGTDAYVRIDAPFLFSVTGATTVTEFAAGQTNSTLSGTGYNLNVRTYVVDKSLSGVDIQENDLLILNGIGYRIIRIVSGNDVSVDAYDSQRITVKDELPLIASTNWSIQSTVKSELLDFYRGLVSAGDEVFFEVNSPTDTGLVSTRVVGISEELPDVLAFDLTPIAGYFAAAENVVRLAKVVRRTYLPVSPDIVEIPILQSELKIVDVEAVLRLNVDYFLETIRGAPALRFLSDSTAQGDVWEGKTPPTRLWAEYTYTDNAEVIEANFGLAAGLSLDKLQTVNADIDYLSAVRGLWYAYFKGPTPYNLRVGAQIFLGLPFAEEQGTIEEIRTDFSATSGRILVRDTANTEIVRSYKFPKFLALEINSSTGVRYAVGDTVTQFAPLVEGVQYLDWIKDPVWFGGLAAQGVVSEAQKYHVFSITIDSKVFSIPAMSLVRDFILQAKATYDYPLFLVKLTVDQTDIDVTDTVVNKVSLNLHDSPCKVNGAPIFDDPRPGGSGGSPPSAWWNSFDTDDSDLTVPPTFPVPDGNVTWAFDRELLCPDDILEAFITRTLAAPTPLSFDMSIWQFDMPLTSFLRYSPSGPFNIPAVPGALTGSTQVPSMVGNLSEIRFRAFGGPGVAPADYELVVVKNGTNVFVQPFTASVSNTHVVVPISPVVSVGLADNITYRIRIPAGSGSPGARVPAWTSLNVFIVVQGLAPVDFDSTIPAGVYSTTVSL